MSKDKMTPERYAVDAMNIAIGALKALKNSESDLDFVIFKLQNAIDKFDPRCDHDWEAAKSPIGGAQATCKKCLVTRYTQ